MDEIEMTDNDNYVERKIPEDTQPIRFHSLDNDLGVINLCCWKEDIINVFGGVSNTKVIQSNHINIHFPMYDKFYVKSYESDNGFTFYNLLKLIYQTGLKAFEVDIKENPSNYKVPSEPWEIIGEYAITSSDNHSDINVLDDDVYISLQH